MKLHSNSSCITMFELAQQHQWRKLSHLIQRDPSILLISNRNGNALLHVLIECFSSTRNSSRNSHLSRENVSSTDGLHDLFQCIFAALQTPEGVKACLISSRYGLTPLNMCCRDAVPVKILKNVALANPRALSIQDNEGDTPLNKALRCGAPDHLLEFLINLAFEDDDLFESFVNKFDVDGNYPIHTAILCNGSCQIFKLLLDIFPQGILSLNNYYQSPLHLASESGRFDLIRTFLHSHCCLSIDCIDTLLRIADNRGRVPLYILWEKVEAAKQSDALLAMHMLLGAFFSPPSQQRDLSIINARQANQLLRVAISLGDIVVPQGYMNHLITTYPILQMANLRDGRLPLHDAAFKLSEQMQSKRSELLYQYDAESDTEEMLDATSSGSHILFAKEYQQKSHTKYHKEQAFPDIELLSVTTLLAMQYPEATSIADNDGRLPCHLAIMNCAPWGSSLKILFTSTPKPIRAIEPSTGLSPFALAASRKQMDSKVQINLIYNLLRGAPDLVS